MTTQSTNKSATQRDEDKPVYHSHYLNGSTYVYIRKAEKVTLEGKKPFFSYKAAMKVGKDSDKKSAMVEGIMSEAAWNYIEPFQNQLDDESISLGVKVNGLRLNGVKAFISKDGDAVPVLDMSIFKVESLLPFKRKSSQNAEASSQDDEEFDDDIPY